MRNIIPLNNNWLFKKEYESGIEKTSNIEGFEVVNLPHTNVELPYNYFDEKCYQITSCYKYLLNIPEEYKGRLMFMHFEGVMSYARVYLNGKIIGEHRGGYTPFDARIDDNYDFSINKNILTVVVDSSERDDIPPFGGQVDYLTYGGIYREVSVGVYDDIFIKNIKVETENVLYKEKSLRIKVFLENIYAQNGEAEFEIYLSEKSGKQVYLKTIKKQISAGQSEYCFIIDNLKNIKLWDIDNPNLYELKIKMKIDNMMDESYVIFGFRMPEFTSEGFYLNGKKIKLMGLNRHQSFPYVGYAMPKRIQEKDAEILKNELHLNIVRTSHYPQSKHFLNRCDELGLLVFEEIPGWNQIGGTEWKNTAKENLKEMIKRDWNHPSIILWGVRINESADDDEFYKDTNKIAHELDISRQTGGVRCITGSHLLEDVYTFNDFIYDGIKAPLRNQMEVTGLDHNVPYLVTECNGHMYPTKRFDNEERQMEHSLRHLRVNNAAGLDDNISGVISWCAFDYNTHKDFGSGDHICYHGVMDMFRINKFASYFYKSQVSPAVEPVLEPVTFWSRGDRSIGGIIPLVIFTNCDYIEFQFGDEVIKNKIYPSLEYKGVSYPPVIIDYSVIDPDEVGSWGMRWEDAIFRGYYKEKLIVQKKLCKNPIPSELYVSADDLCLAASQKDATRIVIKILDQYGNLIPFIDEIIKVEIEGPGRIQGPDEFSLKGGAAAFWVETKNIPGDIYINVYSRSLGQKSLLIKVK